MLTRAVTCGLLNGLGDIFSQLCVEQQAFDAKRCLSFTLLVGKLLKPLANVTACAAVLERQRCSTHTSGLFN